MIKPVFLRLSLSSIGILTAIINIFSTYTDVNSYNGVWIVVLSLSCIEFCNCMDKLYE